MAEIKQNYNADITLPLKSIHRSGSLSVPHQLTRSKAAKLVSLGLVSFEETSRNKQGSKGLVSITDKGLAAIAEQMPDPSSAVILEAATNQVIKAAKEYTEFSQLVHPSTPAGTAFVNLKNSLEKYEAAKD